MSLLVNLLNRIIGRTSEKKTSDEEKKIIRRSKSLSAKASGAKSKSRSVSMVEKSTIVVRPRTNTEVTIDRKRISRGGSIENPQLSRLQRSISVSNSNYEIDRKRSNSTRKVSESSNTVLISRKDPNSTVPAHLNLVSTGSILAPTYRSRAASMKLSNSIKITIQT